MTTYLLIKSAGSNHVTSVAVFDGGIGMRYEFAENEARRINAAIDKAANVDAAIAAAVAAEREACANVEPGMDIGGVLGWNAMTPDERRMWKAGYGCAMEDFSAAIRSRNEAQA